MERKNRKPKPTANAVEGTAPRQSKIKGKLNQDLITQDCSRNVQWHLASESGVYAG